MYFFPWLVTGFLLAAIPTALLGYLLGPRRTTSAVLVAVGLAFGLGLAFFAALNDPPLACTVLGGRTWMLVTFSDGSCSWGIPAAGVAKFGVIVLLALTAVFGLGRAIRLRRATKPLQTND